MIPTNSRRAMRKYLKYNHLLANTVIFANVALLTQAMNELVSEGHLIDPEALPSVQATLQTGEECRTRHPVGVRGWARELRGQQ